MPELPEVETITKQLNKVLKNLKIKGVFLNWQKLIKGVKAKDLEKILKNKKIVKVFRRGKNILIELDNNLILLIHLKLTGRILYGEKEVVLKDPYVRFYLIFDNEKIMALSDLRKFAKVVLFKKDQLNEIEDLKEIGPEPLERTFTLEKFTALINQNKKRKKTIKEILMDQKIIAGIGNIYANEILWEAKINPLKSIRELTEKEIKKLFLSIKKILNLAIEHNGSTISDEMYRDIFGKEGRYGEIRKVYQKEGEKCLRCGAAILKTIQANRSTFYCPKCQKFTRPNFSEI